MKAQRQGPAEERASAVGQAVRHLAEGRAEQAERRCRQILASGGDDQAFRVLAAALRSQGRLDEAMLEARRGVRARPGDPRAHEELGTILLRQDRLPEAVNTLERAIELAPQRPEGHALLGAALLDLGMLDDAAGSFRRVIDLAPDEPAGPVNLGVIAQTQGHFAEAVKAFRRALAMAPGNADVRWNLALSLLGSGDLVSGWREYEHGFAAGQRRPDRQMPLPRWTGDDLMGRRLLVWREQGLGDEIRFASCYADLAARAGALQIEVEPRLVTLLQRSFPHATVRRQSLDPTSGTETRTFDELDLHCPVGSLGQFLRPSLDSFPEHGDYLVADPERRAAWRGRLDALGSGLTVGICWRSMNLATSRLQHYTTLEEWKPVLQVPGLHLVSLQYGPVEHREAELTAAEERFGVDVRRWDDTDYTDDLEEVAALTAELDVVVGPNTFTTILAGALGVPTLVLGLPAVWQHGQDVDPWAPTAEYLTRRWDEPWHPVMERAAARLGEWNHRESR